MRFRNKSGLAGLATVLATLIVFAGCETNDALPVEPLFDIVGNATACADTDVEGGMFKLVKLGGSGTFLVEATLQNEDGSNDEVSEVISLDAGDCAVVHENDDQYPLIDFVRVTETSGDPTLIQCLTIHPPDDEIVQCELFDDVNNVVGDYVALLKGSVATFTNEPEELFGGEGCTPGYWKNHLDSWPAPYAPTDLFNDVFGVEWFDGVTLREALRAKNRDGGGHGRIARHGVAALLSAAHSSVDYSLLVGEVMAAVLAGDADLLEMHNELESPGFCD